MILSHQLAKHLRDVFTGGNWTVSNLNECVQDINHIQATTQIHSFNTIATLVYHIGYFVSAQLRVLRGENLDAKDELSFSHPPLHSEKDWQVLLEGVFADAELLASYIEKMPENLLWDDFTDKKYGSYYRNIQGNIEHIHYHLGQIALIKKLILQQGESAVL